MLKDNLKRRRLFNKWNNRTNNRYNNQMIYCNMIIHIKCWNYRIKFNNYKANYKNNKHIQRKKLKRQNRKS